MQMQQIRGRGIGDNISMTYMRDAKALTITYVEMIRSVVG